MIRLKTADKHFETIVITTFIAKQFIMVQCKNGQTYHGFVQPNLTEEGFMLEEQFISWTEILEIQLTDRYFQFWEDILHLEKNTAESSNGHKK